LGQSRAIVQNIARTTNDEAIAAEQPRWE